jgi:hypothetical protein
MLKLQFAELGSPEPVEVVEISTHPLILRVRGVQLRDQNLLYQRKKELKRLLVKLLHLIYN